MRHYAVVEVGEDSVPSNVQLFINKKSAIAACSAIARQAGVDEEQIADEIVKDNGVTPGVFYSDCTQAGVWVIPLNDL